MLPKLRTRQGIDESREVCNDQCENLSIRRSGRCRMIRKAVRSAMVLFAALAMSLAVSAAPSSASSTLGSRLCETSGKYCLGSDSLALGAAVTEKLKSNNGGRDFFLHPVSGTCCTTSGPGLP